MRLVLSHLYAKQRKEVMCSLPRRRDGKFVCVVLVALEDVAMEGLGNALLLVLPSASKSGRSFFLCALKD